MFIRSIPCLQDNYAYLLRCDVTGQTAVVDPSEAPPVLDALKQAGLSLHAILNTHHHFDHTGGNAELLRHFPGIPVYAHESDRGRIAGQTHFLAAGDVFTLGQLSIQVLHNPGHTHGAVSYAVHDALFTGDTLFGAGCGRVFEGTPAQMYHSLNQVIGACPENTRLFFGHEYTRKNLEFALHVEPDNPAIADRLAAVSTLVQSGHFSTPSELGLERLTNPFLRCAAPAVKAFVQGIEADNPLTPVEVFRVLRAQKDRF
ncbi:MAG: hydroxyacylglutathione hydrolase [Candidatus Sericytochromatia bacterium]